MGKIGGIALIAGGVGILLNIIIMGVGGLQIMIGLFLPIGFKFMPLNEKLQAWVDVPLAMGLDAYMLGVTPIDEEGFIGGGIIEFNVTLSSGGPDDIPAVPVIFIQEDAEIDEIQRYVLRAGPLNYPSIIFWLIALGSLGGFFGALIWRIKLRPKTVKEAVAPAAEPPDVVSVIPLDDEKE